MDVTLPVPAHSPGDTSRLTPFFVASGPTDRSQLAQMGVMIGRQPCATREEAEAEARRGAEERAAAGFGVARTVVIEADDRVGALEAAYLELLAPRWRCRSAPARRSARHGVPGSRGGAGAMTSAPRVL